MIYWSESCGTRLDPSHAIPASELCGTRTHTQVSDYALLSLERALLSWCKLAVLPPHDALAVLRRLLARLLPAPPRLTPRTAPLPELELEGPRPTVGESKGLVRSWLVVCKALLQAPPPPASDTHTRTNTHVRTHRTGRPGEPVVSPGL